MTLELLEKVAFAPGFVQRLFSEKAQLDNNLMKLRSFIESEKFADVADDQKVLLQEQAHHMGEYKRILDLRLENLGYAE